MHIIRGVRTNVTRSSVQRSNNVAFGCDKELRLVAILVEEGCLWAADPLVMPANRQRKVRAHSGTKMIVGSPVIYGFLTYQSLRPAWFS